MSACSLSVVVDPVWVPQFRSGKMNLCSAFSITSSYSKTQFNVVATHEDPAPLNTITWTDQYSIAACKRVQLGAYVNPSTLPVQIRNGQTVKLLRDWTMEIPQTDTNAPTNGFRFVNEPVSSALIFKTIRAHSSPIYVTTVDGAAPPGRQTLIPGGRVMVFFADLEARMAFRPEQVSTQIHEYNYLDHPQMTVYFNSQGQWETVDETTSDAVSIDINNVLAEHRNAVANEANRTPGTADSGNTSKL